MKDPLFDSQFRHACSKFSTGVAVATAIADQETGVGVTINSFTSVSLEPPLVLFCIHNQSNVLRHFRDCEYFGINILSADQIDVSTRFARKDTHYFSLLHEQSGSTGIPVLSGILALFECKLEQVIPCGDHDILIGKVSALSARDGSPLVRYDSSYRTLDTETLWPAQKAVSVRRG